jgi:hypothetical protein
MNSRWSRFHPGDASGEANATLVVRADNARRHVSTRIKQDTEHHSLRTAPYPSYSPDLTLNSFFLFGYVKMALQGPEFQSVKEFLEAIVWIFNAFPTDTSIGTFHECVKRLQACIDNDGEYVESRLFDPKKVSLTSTRHRDAQGNLNTLCAQEAN